MADGLDEEQVDEFREVFALHDKDKDGRINSMELGAVMRWLSWNHTSVELDDMIAKYGSGGTIDINGFLNMMGKRLADKDNEAELIEAFQVFDKDGTGIISCTELRHILANMGEKLSEEEVEQMVAQVDPTGDGSFNYAQFVRNMLQR